MSVELAAEGEVGGETRSGEKARQRVSIRTHPSKQHLSIDIKDIGKLLIREMGLNESVPGKNVPHRNFVEHLVGGERSRQCSRIARDMKFVEPRMLPMWSSCRRKSMNRNRNKRKNIHHRWRLYPAPIKAANDESDNHTFIFIADAKAQFDFEGRILLFIFIGAL